jgi:Phasin protein
MATTDKRKPQAKAKKKTPAKQKAPAKASQPAVRKSAAAQAPASRSVPTPAPVAVEAPVLLNAVEPDEKLVEPKLVEPKLVEPKLIEPAFVESAVDSFEQSLKAAVPAAVAVNSKLVDIVQANMNASMELARDLAGAKSPLEMMRLGMSYWHENMGVFRAQAEELRTLSVAFLATTSKPLRDHIRRA